MRNTKDRIRHAISFEIIGLILITPLGGWVFDKPLFDIGVVGLVSATIAATWNYVFNLIYDHALLRLYGDLRKTPLMRALHAVLFELGLLVFLVPFIALYLRISLTQAFVMDVAFAVFFVVYAFVFNWAYDLLFPIPDPTGPEVSDD